MTWSRTASSLPESQRHNAAGAAAKASSMSAKASKANKSCLQDLELSGKARELPDKGRLPQKPWLQSTVMPLRLLHVTSQIQKHIRTCSRCCLLCKYTAGTCSTAYTCPHLCAFWQIVAFSQKSAQVCTSRVSTLQIELHFVAQHAKPSL